MNNWITNLVRPGIKALFTRKSNQAPAWVKCTSCGHLSSQKDLSNNLKVCVGCDYHMKLTSQERIDIIFDSYSLIENVESCDDPIKFVDSKKYINRLLEARSKTGLFDAATVIQGYIGKFKTISMIMDFRFIGGSMGTYVGNAFINAIQQASINKAPFIAFTASGGARMQEGILSLMQMPRTIAALKVLKKHNLPYIVVITDPTAGGVIASFAALGDVTIAEPNAMIGFAGARVIEQTIRQSLPEGFQRPDYLLSHGMLDVIIHRKKLKDELTKLLSLLCSKESH